MKKGNRVRMKEIRERLPKPDLGPSHVETNFVTTNGTHWYEARKYDCLRETDSA